MVLKVSNFLINDSIELMEKIYKFKNYVFNFLLHTINNHFIVQLFIINKRNMDLIENNLSFIKLVPIK